MAVMTTDVMLLGRFSQLALAAAAIGNTIYFFAWLVGGGTRVGRLAHGRPLIGERPRTRGGVRASFRMGAVGGPAPLGADDGAHAVRRTDPARPGPGTHAGG